MSAYTPLLPFNAWYMASSPVIPSFYWDVVSSEQRVKEICCRLSKLIDYADAINENVSAIESDVDSQMGAYLAQMTKNLSILKNELEKELREVVGSSLDWDVTRGQNAPSIEAHRRELAWTTPGGTTVGTLATTATGPQTVADLATCGLNCRGLATQARTFFSNGAAAVSPECLI